MATQKDDPASQQLPKWSQSHQHVPENHIKNEAGIFLPFQTASITVGPHGPIVLSDYNLVEQLAHFNRERIPERVVHAKGAGAFGSFKCTADLSNITMSPIFKAGKKTDIAVRFSEVFESLGSADTVRDIRGFALKFYTDDGIWDLVGNNVPIFFFRDPVLFPMFVHSQRPNPATGLKDWNARWDFWTLRPETLHLAMMLMSDRGIPDGHRHMHGYGGHTFSFINKDRKLTWVRFTYDTDQGIQTLTEEEAMRIAGEDPDYAVRDLYDAIADKKFPSWTMKIQTMSAEKAKELMNNKKTPFNPFDITKVWPHGKFPLQEIGKFVLDRNPSNMFADIEQLAFSPNNLTPGIGASPDRLLQGRLFAYQDAHRYRLGVNFQQIPVNKPYDKIKNYQRDGLPTLDSQGGAPNYYPNSFGGPKVNSEEIKWIRPPMEECGLVDYYDLRDEDNYTQPRRFWQKVLNEKKKGLLVATMANTLKLTTDEIRKRAIMEFTKVDTTLGSRLADRLTAVGAPTEKVVHL